MANDTVKGKRPTHRIVATQKDNDFGASAGWYEVGVAWSDERGMALRFSPFADLSALREAVVVVRPIQRDTEAAAPPAVMVPAKGSEERRDTSKPFVFGEDVPRVPRRR